MLLFSIIITIAIIIQTIGPFALLYRGSLTPYNPLSCQPYSLEFPRCSLAQAARSQSVCTTTSVGWAMTTDSSPALPAPARVPRSTRAPHLYGPTLPQEASCMRPSPQCSSNNSTSAGRQWPRWSLYVQHRDQIGRNTYYGFHSPPRVYVVYRSANAGLWVLTCSHDHPHAADPILSWAEERDDEVDISEIDLFRHQALLPFVPAGLENRRSLDLTTDEA